MFNGETRSNNEENFKKYTKKSRFEQQKAFLIAFVLYCAPVALAVLKQRMIHSSFDHPYLGPRDLGRSSAFFRSCIVSSTFSTSDEQHRKCLYVDRLKF
ncbi:hypothetical protein PCK1_003202 [Pneumocystis canis]|nr:hypothetical protein PCK1_003202 [Pneumocystis canis]